MATTEHAEILEDDSARPSKRTRASAFGITDPDATYRALSYPRGALDDLTNTSQRRMRDQLGVLAADGDRVELQQRGRLSLHALRWARHG